MLLSVILILLPSLSNSYVVKVQGQVEMGDHVATLLKFLQSQLAGSFQKSEDKKPEVTNRPEGSKKLEAPLIEEIMRKDTLTHLYGAHDKHNEKYKNINIKV